MSVPLSLIEIDNNGVENAIRPTAIGEADASRTSAIHPWAYLRDVPTRSPTMTNRQIKEVTPAAWAAVSAQRAAA